MTDAGQDHVIHGNFPAGGPIEFCSDHHYLLYAREGLLHLDDDGRRWSLPPARAALIAAGRTITFRLPRPVVALSVLFKPDGRPPASALSVFAMPPLARALLEELRQCTGGPADPHETLLFQTLRSTVWRLSHGPVPLHRPTGHSPLVRRALDRTEATLAEDPTFAALARDLSVTGRTLARHILAETGMTWRANLRRMRVMRAVDLLAAGPGSVTEIALTCGYTSLSAFNAAFRDLTGMTPSEYRDSLR